MVGTGALRSTRSEIELALTRDLEACFSTLGLLFLLQSRSPERKTMNPVTASLNRLSRLCFDHRSYSRRAVQRWLRENRNLLQGRVLDIGSKPGRGLFAMQPHANDRWVGLNITPIAQPDVLASGEALPFPADAFDAVVCSQVIEHVPDPVAIVTEAYRVLRQGGHLLLSSPFLCPIHGDPHDYNRLTETALRRLLQSFRTVDVAVGGYLATVAGDILKRWLHGTSRRHIYKYLFYPLLPLVHLSVRFERWPVIRRSCERQGIVSGYMIVAKK